MTALTTDPGFDINRTEEYKLSIQVNLDGFSFSVVHLHENRLLAAGQFPITISSESFLGRRFTEWMNDTELLQKKYSVVQFYYFSEKFTLVPSSFYEFKKQNKIIEEAFGKQKGISVRDNYLPEDEANLVFTIPDSLMEAFEKKFPGNIILHPVSLLSQKLHQNFLNNEDKSILALCFQNNFFSLLLYFQKKLQISNSFCYKHPNDVIFYILSVLKVLKLNTSETGLLLAGNINQDDAIHSLLSEYFEKTEFISPSCQFNKTIFKAPLHPYIPLI